MSEPLIIVIFGPSGSGKTTLVKNFDHSGNEYSVHMKDTDREKRDYDDYEINCITNFDSNNYDYVYQTYGYRYGITKKQIEEAIEKGQRHLIICNDISTIIRLKDDFGNLVRVLFYYFDAPHDEILKIQKNRNISDDEINLRITKISSLYKQFVDNYNLFTGAISVSFGENIDSIKAKIEGAIHEAKVIGSSQRIIEKMSEIISNLNSANLPCQENYAFVIMPIKEDDTSNIDIYHEIVQTCNELSIKAERVDAIQFTGQITEKIQTSIKISEFLIADISDNRPNVYYEIGYADALKKPIILIARKGTEPHFDIQNNNILFYNGMKNLHDILNKRIIGIKGK